ncbi:MAG: hypothetical protein GY703_17365 [Gammaproteobacteria bacterium]|nr:hypothetical protein [Gammaproteobacteria bacterium]
MKRAPTRTALRYQVGRRGQSKEPVGPVSHIARRPYEAVMINGVAACRFHLFDAPPTISLASIARTLGTKLASLFPATFFSLPRGSVNLFQSFRAMLVGCKAQVAELTAHRVCNVLNKLLANMYSPSCYAVIQDLKYTNMSGTLCIGHPIDLVALYKACPGLTDFHPERYNAVNFRFSQPDLQTNVTSTVYATGSIVVHGATNYTILEAALHAMADFITSETVQTSVSNPTHPFLFPLNTHLDRRLCMH